MKIVGFAAALLLAGCVPPDEDDNLRQALDRADVLKVCTDGTKLGRDPISGRLLWGTWTGNGWVAPGVTPEQFCR